MNTVFIKPNIHLPTDIRIQVVVGHGANQPESEIIQNPVMKEIVFPLGTSRDPSTLFDPKLLELYLISGLSIKS